MSHCPLRLSLSLTPCVAHSLSMHASVSPSLLLSIHYISLYPPIYPFNLSISFLYPFFCLHSVFLIVFTPPSPSLSPTLSLSVSLSFSLSLSLSLSFSSIFLLSYTTFFSFIYRSPFFLARFLYLSFPLLNLFFLSHLSAFLSFNLVPFFLPSLSLPFLVSLLIEL